MSTKFSFAITTHNEGNSIKYLLDSILNAEKDYDFEIVILDDYSTEKATLDILNLYGKYINIKVKYEKFNNNFAAHKNLLNSYCEGDYIINIDADEYLDSFLVSNIDKIVESNPDIELFWVPRVNVVYGLTDQHVRMWKWRVSAVDWCEHPVINFPDYQARIYKNLPSKIKWHRKVHEYIQGAETFTYLPATKEYCIMHEKPIFKQEQQNKLYGEIFYDNQ